MRILLALCDVCDAGGAETRGETFGFAVNGGKPVGVDLCAAHAEQLVTPLVDVLARHGAPFEPTRPRQQRPTQPRVDRAELPMVPCPMGDTSRTGLQSLVAHVRADHGYDFGPAPSVKFYGTTCPLCGVESHKLGHHAQYNHPEVVGGVQALFDEALARGDGLGVVARNEKRLRDLIRGVAADAEA